MTLIVFITMLIIIFLFSTVFVIICIHHGAHRNIYPSRGSVYSVHRGGHHHAVHYAVYYAVHRGVCSGVPSLHHVRAVPDDNHAAHTRCHG